jgi:predicted ATP-binding protein involved in virulence
MPRSRKSGSRKSRSRKSRSRRSSLKGLKKSSHRHYSLKGLNDWHDHEFRHLGWMVLSKHNHVNDKVVAYKNSVNRLLKAIEQEIRECSSADKLHDLQILHDNVKVLKQHVKKDF